MSLDIIVPTALVADESIRRQCITCASLDTKTKDARLILVVNTDMEDYGPTLAAMTDQWTRGTPVVLMMDGLSGFSRACNYGLTYSSADWVCLLSDDVFVCSDWDTTIIDVMNKTSAAIGTATCDTNGRYQFVESWKDIDDPIAVNHMVSFIAPVMHRATIEKYGLLSTHPALAQLGSDNEYCSRVLKGGGLIIIVPQCMFTGPKRSTISKVGNKWYKGSPTNYLKQIKVHPGCL